MFFACVLLSVSYGGTHVLRAKRGFSSLLSKLLDLLLWLKCVFFILRSGVIIALVRYFILFLVKLVCVLCFVVGVG